MHVGVLGGGLQGCCAGLALAERGIRVTIIDRNEALLARTAVANEGKIHLGYMYAGDPSLATARTMIKGALAFAPFFRRQLGEAAPLPTSVPAAYVVHRDSQQPAEAVAAYLNRVHALIGEAAAARPGDYFGMDLAAPLRPWSRRELAEALSAEHVEAVFDTPEVAINPVELAEAVRARIASDPAIETLLGLTVKGADFDGDGIIIEVAGAEGTARLRFDHVVNALWDGRLMLNESAGLPAGRRWLHRLKYGVSFRLPPGAAAPPSTTFVLGPFGEVVRYEGGLVYLTWYPECVPEMSSALAPPDWPTYPGEPLRSRIIAGTLRALAGVVTALRGLDPEDLPEATVKGGAIVAWGETDIYDPESELHRRYEIGVTSKGRFHSVDPGKLTMAPYFADAVAARIAA
jgi:glycine/D-amino acid oxidase-like deaminating enzyme